MDRREDDARRSNDVAPATDGSLSRRDFLRLPAALALLTGVAGCSRPSAGNDARTRIDLVRANDQLALAVEFDNLMIVDTGRGRSLLVRAEAAEPATLRIVFPPQHLAEHALADRATIPAGPVPSLAAGPSSLVFRLPESVRSIPLTTEALLDWSQWTAAWPDEAATTAAADASLLELPSGLALSPGPNAAWRHSVHPVTWRGRTELWHTRLEGTSPGVRTVRVLATGRDTTALDAIGAPLDRDTREALYGKSVEARTLLLSPYGGWLDLRGRWDGEADGIGRWEHRAGAGRDNHVLVERPPGYLYPFGHRAARVSVTERRGDGKGPALLRTRDFIVIKEPVVEYRQGEMPFAALTALTTTTPPLDIPGDAGDAFWIETEGDGPFLFRFEGRDWSGARCAVEAQAVFVEPVDEPVDEARLRDALAAAAKRYSDDTRAIVALNRQAVVVAPFEGPEREDGRARTAGETTLNVLRARFVARTGDASPRPFTCAARYLDASVPALTPYLAADENLGRFTLDDPTEGDNEGEVFARILEGEAPIPVTFARHADRIGGLVTPAVRVDGISRTQGAVGHVDRVREGKEIDPAVYYVEESALLLGVFPLVDLLKLLPSEKPAAMPQIVMDIVPDAQKKKPDEDGEGAEKKDKDPEGGGYALTLALKWSFDIPKFDLLFVTLRSAKGKQARLTLDATTKKHFGGSASDDDESADDDSSESDSDKSQKRERIDWKVEAEARDLTLALNAAALGGLDVGIEKLKVTLGPPDPKKAGSSDDDKRAADDDTAPEEEEKQDDEPAIEPEFDFKLGTVKGSGALAFINPLMDLMGKLPKPPKIGDEPPPLAYPAKLPDVGDADISIRIGPFVIPDFRWLRFEVSGVETRLGVGLYLFQRKGRVPDPLFTLRIASADKPIRLIAEPWGGTAFVAANLTPRGLTGFQFSVGIIYRETFDFGAARATCSGSLAGVFTYLQRSDEDGGNLEELVILLKLHGAATVAGFIGITIDLTAVGRAAENTWTFSASLRVGVHIGFFSVSVTLSLTYTMVSSGGQACRALLGAVPDGSAAAWRAYRDAFAAVA